MGALASNLATSPWGAELALLAEVSLKGAVLLLVAGCVARGWRRASAAQRHLVWLLALGSLLVLPGVTRVVPRWHLPLIGPVMRLPLVPPPAAAAHGSAAHLPGALRTSPPSSIEAVEAPAPFTGLLLDGSGVVLGLWMVGVLSVLGLLAIAIVRAALLRRVAPPIAAGRCTDAVSSLAGRVGVGRVPAVRELPSGAMPMTCGILRPVILLPRDAERWPQARLKAVLLHELAHVRRRDILTQLAAQVACALFWFNPLVWTAFRRLRLEGERACDDAVLRAGIRPSEYAGHLLTLARSRRGGSLTAPAFSSMVEPSQIVVRIGAVVAERSARGGLSAGIAALLVIAGGALCVGVAAAAPGPSRSAPETGPATATVPRVRTAPPADGGPTGARAAERALAAASMDQPSTDIPPVVGETEVPPDPARRADPNQRTIAADEVEPVAPSAPVMRPPLSPAPVARPRPGPAIVLPVGRTVEPVTPSARRGRGRGSRGLISYSYGRIPAECQQVAVLSTVGQPDPIGYQPNLHWEVTARGGNAIARRLTQHIVLFCS